MDLEGALSSLWGGHGISYRLSSTCSYASSPSLAGREAPGCGLIRVTAEGCERCDGAMHTTEWSTRLQGLGDVKDN